MLIFNIEFNEDDLRQKDLIRFAETRAVTDDIVKEYLVALLVEDDNVLCEICERGIKPGSSLRAAAAGDIEQLMKSVHKIKENPAGRLLKDYEKSVNMSMYFEEYALSLKQIVSKDDVAGMLELIIAHYSDFGGGPLAKYSAFKWEKGLKGIESPDEITLDRLFCLESQKQILIQNTVSFLRGSAANNVLLYGESGCGKSSVVKALLNEYKQEGLRMVEIARDSLCELPLLIDAVKERRQKHIVFMDDLSFEDDDMRYKALKTALEGSMEKQPDNILFYATSNRFHIVNETWEQRQGGDIHVSDTKNEKLSLSERFGIRISFFSPGQEEYLKIVEGILSLKDIDMTDDIRALALKWALQYNGRSGRSAAQFANGFIASKSR